MQNFIKKIVWVCLLIIPFVALHVADAGLFDVTSWFGGNGLFFPFISGKNLIFRFLVEIAFAGWAVLALYDSGYRINVKKSPIMIAYSLFIIVLFLADLFGVDRERSFWSNFERMEGFVGHIHFFAYFFVLTVMVRSLEEWKTMWKAFIISDILVVGYGYCQLIGAKGFFFADHFPKISAWFSSRFAIHMSETRLDATIGNSAYFAIFCLMYIFIAALLWAQSKQPLSKARLYPALIIFNLVGIIFSGTRGTMIGVFFGGLLALGIMALKEKGKLRQMLIVSIVAPVLVVGMLFAAKNTSFIQGSPVLARIVSISPNDITGASRLSMWKISYQAFLKHPILGYGQDNFSYIFARKFLPEKMCNLEPWYDRSHDVFFDWLVAAGILGLITYLSLYGVTLWFMWRGNNTVPYVEKAILTGLLAGYFIHNIFVFDNLTSYILFFAILAYITVRTQDRHVIPHGKPLFDDEQMKLLWIPIIGLSLLVVQYYVNYRPIVVNRLVIDGMSINRYAQTMPFPDAVKRLQDSFTSAIAMNTLGSIEAREQFLQMAVQIPRITIPPETPAAEKQAIQTALGGLISVAKNDVTKSLPEHSDDVRMLSIYGMFYNGIGDSQAAEGVLTKALTIAPNKQLLAFDLERSFLIQKKYSDAFTLAKKTYDLSNDCHDALKWLMIGAAYSGKYKEARAYVIGKGQTVPFDQDVLGGLVATGQTGLVIEILLDLKKSNPEYASQVDEYIRQLLVPQKK
jgi:O-antigen ligase/tetratricopeptide (TPR) repeat protein